LKTFRKENLIRTLTARFLYNRGGRKGTKTLLPGKKFDCYNACGSFLPEREKPREGKEVSDKKKPPPPEGKGKQKMPLVRRDMPVLEGRVAPDSTTQTIIIRI